MKTWKNEIVNAIVEKTTTDKIVSLKETANALGVAHINRHDTDDIINAVLKRVPEYKAVEMHDTATDTASRFCTLCFIDKELTFDNEI